MSNDGNFDILPEDIMNIMDECYTVLHNDDVDTNLQDCTSKEILQWKELLKRREDSVKESIKVLQEECDHEAEKLQPKETNHQKQSLEELKRQLDSERIHKQEIISNLNQSKKNSEKYYREAEILKEKELEAKPNKSEDIPTLRHKVNLFSHISNIRWEFNSNSEEIKGYVCNKDNVKPFALNSKQNSSSFIANYLWDLVEPDW